MSPQKPRKASRLHLAAAILTLAAATVLGASCANDARDSHCEAETPDEDDCISNPEGLGPAVKEGRCASPSAADPVPAPADCPGFGAVYEFMRDPLKGNCFASGCHGSEGTAAVGVFLRPTLPSGQDDLCGIYAKLKSTSGSVGSPYVVEDVLGADGLPDATNEALGSWMYCNVAGLPGGSFPMPKPGGVPVKEDAELIKTWILCGAHAADLGCPEPPTP